jgi:microcystin-dependent protein
MSNPYLGEIRIMAFNFAPKGWALANGQIMSISQNNALFALLGTTYGGNGVQTFALPNLQSRVPVSFGTDSIGNAYVLGQIGGQESHALAISEIAVHGHGTVQGTSTSAGTTAVPTGNVLAGVSDVYTSDTSHPVVLAPSAVSTVGSNQGHENRQPFLALNFCIALQGIFPSRN